MEKKESYKEYQNQEDNKRTVLSYIGGNMIKENGMRAFSDDNYDYYELIQDFGRLKRGSIFVHDKDDRMYGSIAEGCLKLCWTPDGNCYSGMCANTIFLHFTMAKDEYSIFKLAQSKNDKLWIKQKIIEIEDEIKSLKKKILG